MSRLQKTQGLKTVRAEEVTKEPASPKATKLKKPDSSENIVQTIRATVSFPATADFTETLANYIRDIELSLPPGGKAPKPAEIFRSFLDANDAELTAMLKDHLSSWGRS